MRSFSLFPLSFLARDLREILCVVVAQLLETAVASEKMHKLDEHIGVAVAGINSDANILINSAR